MKFNWKIAVAIVVILGVGFWGFDSLRARSYSGEDISFPVGSGTVTLTNSTDAAIPVQLVGSGVRAFSLINATMDVTGSSTRDGNGSRATQTFEFELPSGVSEFAIARGKDVTLTASATKTLEATVQPLSAGDSQTTLIITVIVVLVALFYISHTTGHTWLARFRSTAQSKQITEPVATTSGASQGNNMQSFGDNRANTGD